MPETIQDYHKEREGQYQSRINFSDLNRGDKLVVETQVDGDPQRIQATFEIEVIGKRKERTRGTGQKERCLRVKVVEIDNSTGSEREFISRTPGGMRRRHGITLGTFELGEENCLYFENLKDMQGERLAGAMRSTPIMSIYVIRSKK